MLTYFGKSIPNDPFFVNEHSHIECLEKFSCYTDPLPIWVAMSMHIGVAG